MAPTPFPGGAAADTALDYLVATKKPYYLPIGAGGPVADQQIERFANIVENALLPACVPAGDRVPGAEKAAVGAAEIFTAIAQGDDAMKNSQIDYRHLVEVLGQPGRRSDDVPHRRNVARVRVDEATAQELAMLLADEHARRVAAQYEARVRGADADERLRLRHASRRIQRLLWETRRTIQEQGWNE